MNKLQFLAILSTASWLSLGKIARAEGVDKSSCNLFNPVPREKMKELSTDRPDRTESPITVDAGHFQIETDIINQSRNKVKPTDTKDTSTLFLASNLKLGLTQSTDLQLVVTPSQEEKTEVQGRTKRVTGFGDTVLRLKINFMGNDGGPVALGLIPFVKLPTAKDELGNKKYEGGIILPIGLSLPEEWELGMMFQMNYAKNEDNDRYHNEFVSSITAAHDIIKGMSGYLEFYSQVSKDVEVEWLATVDVGLTFGVSSDVQLDVGVNVGVTDASDDLNPFVGISARI